MSFFFSRMLSWGLQYEIGWRAERVTLEYSNILSVRYQDDKLNMQFSEITANAKYRQVITITINTVHNNTKDTNGLHRWLVFMYWGQNLQMIETFFVREVLTPFSGTCIMQSDTSFVCYEILASIRTRVAPTSACDRIGPSSSASASISGAGGGRGRTAASVTDGGGGFHSLSNSCNTSNGVSIVYQLQAENNSKYSKLSS